MKSGKCREVSRYSRVYVVYVREGMSNINIFIIYTFVFVVHLIHSHTSNTHATIVRTIAQHILGRSEHILSRCQIARKRKK